MSAIGSPFNMFEEETMKRCPRFAVALLLVAFTLTGCQSNKMAAPRFDSFKSLFKGKNKEDEKKPPVRMAVIWKDSVYESAGSPNVRGLGGRIFFYDEDNNPTIADGELIVYGYDDSKEQDESDAADRKFIFPADKFQDHYGKTDLGDSYSIWVPWDPVGGVRTTVSLIPIFKTTDGRVLKNGQTLCVLPGTAPPRNDEPEVKLNRIRSFAGMESRIPTNTKLQQGMNVISQTGGIDDEALIDHIGSQTATVNYSSRIRASTISVPKTLADQMKQLPPQTIQEKTKSETVNYAAEMLKRISAKRAELRAEEKEDDSNGKQKYPLNRPAFGMPGKLN